MSHPPNDLPPTIELLEAPAATDKYYFVMSPENHDGLITRSITRTDYLRWRRHFREMSDIADIRSTAASPCRRCGISSYRAESLLSAMYTLERLPAFRAFYESTYLVPLEFLVAMCRELDCLADEDLPLIDEPLSRLFTPTRRGQNLPTQAEIRRRIQALIREIDADIEPNKNVAPPEEDKDPQSPRGISNLETWDSPSGTLVSFGIDPDTWAEVTTRIKRHAEDTDASTEEALLSLLRGEPGPRVTLYMFKASDVPENSPAYVEGIVWVHPDYAADLASKATKVLDADELLKATSEKYSCPEDIAGAVRGRDATCRFPGCGRKAANCDLDHRVNHADGGPTSPGNLACLCRTHHNMKTDGTIAYVMDPVTGAITWLLEDGTYATSDPTGPLSTTGRHWVRTFSSRWTARRNRARQAAKERKVRLEGLIEREVDFFLSDTDRTPY